MVTGIKISLRGLSAYLTDFMFTNAKGKNME